MKEFWKKNKFIISGVWAVCTTILSLYWAVYPLKQGAKLTYYKKSEVDVFSIDNPINEFRIILNGKDMRKENLNLRVIKYRVINDGRMDIQVSSYVDGIPFGIKVKGGKIVRVQLTKDNSTIKKDNLINNFSSDSTMVHFNHLFWGEDEDIVFDIWVLHNKGGNPHVIPIGRIADGAISLADENQPRLDQSTLMIIAILSMILWPIVYLIRKIIHKIKSSRIERFRTQYLIKKYDLNYDPTNKSQKVIIRFWHQVGYTEFINVLKLVSDKERLSEQVRKKDQIMHLWRGLVNDLGSMHYRYEYYEILRFDGSIWELVDMLLAAELAISNDEGIQIKQEFIDQVNLTLKVCEK